MTCRKCKEATPWIIRFLNCGLCKLCYDAMEEANWERQEDYERSRMKQRRKEIEKRKEKYFK